MAESFRFLRCFRSVHRPVAACMLIATMLPVLVLCLQMNSPSAPLVLKLALSKSSTRTQGIHLWRRHFLYWDRSSQGPLDPCPSSQSWPPGTWTSLVDTKWSARLSHKQQLLHASAVLPSIHETLWALWKHQHPQDCKQARFAVYPGYTSGFGSVLHVETAALAAIWESERIMWEAKGSFLAPASYCGENKSLDSCYFLPLSNCTLHNAGLSQQDLDSAPTVSSLEQLAQSPARVVVWSTDATLKYNGKGPSAVASRLKDRGIAEDRAFWWWRALGVAYILRPNARTLAELQRRRHDKLVGPTLRQGCVSLYIRHGDKGKENVVFEDPAYEAAVQRLLTVDPALSTQVFLSTEDPHTVEYFLNASKGMAVTYVDMKRKPDRTKSNLEYMQQHGYHEEVLDGLLNLDLALQCDGFVSSFTSNWARLIEELRSTVRCKAGAMYVDVDPAFALNATPREGEWPYSRKNGFW